MSSISVPLELVDRYDRPTPRYTSYPTIPVWESEFGEADYLRALKSPANKPDDTLSLYVHLPFCAQGCWYCGCNSIVTHKSSAIDAYLDRLEAEIRIVTRHLGHDRRVVQLHLGGGTPNHLSADQMSRLIGMPRAAFTFDGVLEQSLEVDPRIGTPEQLGFFRSAGFNRVSFGVQDFNPRVQQAIGRIQSLEQTAGLFNAARELGYGGVNFDLVYGLPAQTEESFVETVKTVLDLGPDRVACFNYAHVPWMRANQRRIDESLLPTRHQKFHLFQRAVELFTDAGYVWIGLDHFARPGDELSTAMNEGRMHRNFMGYTTRPGDHLLAFGMSAISELAGCYVQNDARLPGYQKTIDAGHLPVSRGHWMTTDDAIRRRAITSLMCNLELPFDLTRDEFGVDVKEALGTSLDNLRPFEADGCLVFERDRIRVTPVGRFFIRNVCVELDAYLAGPRTHQLRFSKSV